MKRRLPSVVLLASVLLVMTAVVTAAPATAAVVTADPTSVPNTSTAAAVTFNVGGHATLLATGAKVTMTGPTGNPLAATFTDDSPTVSIINSSVTATFNLDPGTLPPRPGDYDVAIIYTGIGGPTTEDTSTVTVTNAQPTLSASVELPAGESGVPLAITATTGNFAAGDILSFTDSDSHVVDGLSFSSPDLEGTSFSGDIGAAPATVPGTYDITITDTAGGTAICAGCVIVDPGTGVVRNLKAASVGHTSATLTWLAPSTGPTPTGYSVFVSTDPNPTSTDSGLNVTQTGSEPHATVTGLSAGTRYYAAVVATTIAGPGDPAPLTFFAGEPSTLTLSHTNLKLKFGQKLTLSGHLASGSKSLPDQSVVIYEKVGTGNAHPIKTVLTDTSGNYAYTFTPPFNASYYTKYDGGVGSAQGPAIDQARSATISGTVAQVITLKGAAIHHTKWLRLSGTVAPGAPGRTVVIYNLVHGHLKKYATAKLSSTSTYKVVLKHVKSGRYKLVAKIAATRINLAGTSQRLAVRKP